MIRGHIERMGEPIGRVKWILVSDAHSDHMGAVAALKAMSGAKVAAGAPDIAALERGAPPGETSYTPVPFRPIHADRAVKNGDRVRLGTVTLVAVATPGQTPGCTSWTMRAEGHAVIFPCSVTVAGNRLVGNHAYPAIVADYRTSLARLAAIHTDVVLPTHPEVADVIARAKTGRLVDPTLLPAIVASSRRAFDVELARQQGRAAK